MATSPTQRSLKYLRDQGYRCWIVERWCPYAKRRIDLWNCIDILAIGNGQTIGVQTTTRSHVAARVKKIEENEYYPELIRSGWKIHVHGWGKLKAGWTIKIVELN
jgi:hypothetical protein